MAVVELSTKGASLSIRLPRSGAPAVLPANVASFGQARAQRDADKHGRL